MPVPRRTVTRRAADRRRAARGASSRLAPRRIKTGVTADPTEDDFPPPTKAQIAELKRRIAEMDDPTRYLIVSAFSRRHVLYYDAGTDCYVMNRPEDGTVFKYHAVAKAALAALQARRRRGHDDSLQIVMARKTKSGLRIVTKPVGLLDRLRTRRRSIGNRKSKIENS